MNADSALARAYLYHRQCRYRPSMAKRLAREDVITGRSRYPRCIKGSGNQPWELAGGRFVWVEEPLFACSRGVPKEAHRVLQHMRHTGWLTDPLDHKTVTCGVVMRLPARGGKERFLAGFTDPDNDGPIAVCIDTIFDDEGEAARDGDAYASAYAEMCREHVEAWRAAQDVADKRRDMSAIRQEALDAIRNLRAMRKSVEALVRRACADLEERREEVAELISRWRKHDNFDPDEH